MNNEACKNAFDAFKKISIEEFVNFMSALNYEQFEPAAQMISEAQAKGNRVHITGIGKPSHVANYIASLLSSTGTPTVFLHGTEATHGSCGQLVPGDVVICISNSGETAELKATATAILNNGCRIIAVTGNPDSWLAAHAEAHLYAGVSQEGGPLNRAPRTSILAETAVLQGLSVILQVNRGLDPKQYIKWHPGGALGHLRESEK
ncbi:MAG: SIS domain-containing protein [Clostridia bacterium]|nr:SIS domain-containing protein [Clostridia bacterium]